MPTMKTTITLNEKEIVEALTDYLRSKRYEVQGDIVFVSEEDGEEMTTVNATATVDAIPRKKRGDGKEDDAAK